jgi:hypothetical protein
MRQFQSRVAELGQENVTAVCHFADHGGGLPELCDVREVVRLCERLVVLGYPSFLHVSTSCRRLAPDKPWMSARVGLGAFEVWCLARGRVGGVGPVTLKPAEVQQFFADLRAMREEAGRRLAVKGGAR